MILYLWDIIFVFLTIAKPSVKYLIQIAHPASGLYPY